MNPMPVDLQSVFGRNLRTRRKVLHLSQEEVGERAGMNKNYVSRVEEGQLNITLGTMKRLATALDLDVLTLLGGRPINPDECDE